MMAINTHEISVLIVDDDPVIRLLMKRALSNSNFHIIEAESGEQAIELFEYHSPELVLLDVTMDGMDGFECCSAIRTLENGKDVAIIIVTASDRTEDITKAFELGATDFITKPIKWPLFSHRVHYVQKANKTIKELTLNKNKLAKAQNIGHLGSWEWDFNSPTLDCSDELYRMLGMEQQPIPVTFPLALRFIHPDDRKKFKQAIRSILYDKKPCEIECRVIDKKGNILTVVNRIDISNNYEQWHISGTLHDITDRKNSEQEIAYYAYYDTLTTLPNRRLFIEQLESAIDTAKRHHEKLSLLFIDLDHFKHVNDTHGHQAGDELLFQAAKRIKECVRMSDVVGSPTTPQRNNNVARLAGDEFTVLLCEMDAVDNVAIVCQRIIAAFSKPFRLNGFHTHLSVSIGVACYPDDSTSGDTLLQRADTAMYQAKKNGRNNYQLFSAAMHNHLMDRLQIESDLRDALDNGDQFVLFYQPQIEFISDKVVGFEALLRWQHPTRGLLGPDSFIHIAESSGLIIDIGQWVLTEACKQAKKWQSLYRMGVNLSAQEFNHKSLPEQVKRALDETGLPAHLLELEITETAIINDISDTIPLLFDLKKLGVKLAIDDFGTGYSSLSYLKNFPIDTLKIDKSFVDEIVTSNKDAAIAQTIIQLAHNLGLVTIAEGVENTQQRQLLEDMGSSEFQGYLYSKPFPAEIIEQIYLL
jgi:diguanylate cyclase (GGDEF)-like protein/PAS domain S-box-containing protein